MILSHRSNTENPVISGIKKYRIQIIVLIMLLLSMWVYYNLWIKLCNQILVDPIMSQINGKYLLPICSIFCALIIISYYIPILYRERVLNFKRITFVSIFTIIYILCFISNEWNYKIIPNTTLAYAHISFLIPFFELIQTILILKLHKEHESKTKLRFEIENTGCLCQDKRTRNNDNPYQNDNYNRIYNVKACATILKSSFYEEQSFALALIGSWGSGKTSFLEGLKEKMGDQKDLIFINYNPWKCDKPQTIIKSFFDIYCATMDQYIPTLSSKIDKYVFELLGQSNSIFVQVLSKMGALCVNDRENNTDQYETIKKVLKQAKLKTVIIIDDLDRLEGNEIFEVCRLIRNTANFPYIQFIVSFEKEYIIRSLNKKRISNPNQYLEKIFNLEVPLSKIPEKVICDTLYKYLENTLSIKELFPKKDNKDVITDIKKNIIVLFHKDQDQETARKSTMSSPSRNYYLIPQILKTNRDIIRYNNSFMLLVAFYVEANNINEINLIDLFYLELLRYYDLKKFETLKNNPLNFPGMKIDNGCYYFSSANVNIVQTDDSYKIFNFILNILFSNPQKKTYSINNSIFALRHFDKYFLYNSDPNRISFSQFLDLDNSENIQEEASELHKNKPNEFKWQVKSILATISTFYKQQKISEGDNLNKILCSIIKKLSTVPYSKLRYEITQGASFSMKNFQLYSTSQLKYFLNLINFLDFTQQHYSLEELCLKLLDKKALFKNTKYPNKIEVEVVEIIEKFLLNANEFITLNNQDKYSNVLIFSKTITSTVKNFKKQNKHLKSLTLSYSKLLDIKISYFKNYPDKLDPLYGYELFSLCTESTDEELHTHLNSKAIDLMCNYIQQNPQKYDDVFVVREEHDEFYSYKPEIYYKQIFRSMENFEDFIENQPKEKIPKINDFWKQYKSNNYQEIHKPKYMQPIQYY